MNIEIAFISNETGELVNRDIQMVCVDKDKHIYRPQEGYSMVVLVAGRFVLNINNEEEQNESAI